MQVSTENGARSSPIGAGKSDSTVKATAAGSNGRTDYYRTPRARRIHPEAIPRELRDRPQWVCWRRETRDGKPTKVLYQARIPGLKAKSNDPETWATFDAAMAAFLKAGNRFDGIGYVFSPDDPFAGIDLDGCLGPDGEVLEWARPYLERFRSYAEVSPSGLGVKIIVLGELAGEKGTRHAGFGPAGKGAVECYDRTRFFTITGDCFDTGQATIEDCGAALKALHAELTRKTEKAARKARPEAEGRAAASTVAALDGDDGALLERIRRSRQGPKFIALYDRGDTSAYHDDDSAADFALCTILAFWTNKDAARIERLFNGSALARREKWNRADYRERTIAAACDATTEVYSPHPERNGHGTKKPTPRTEDRVEIEVTTKRHEVLAQALAALRHDPELYRRGDVLVTVAIETEDEIPLSGSTVLKGMAGAPRVVPLSPAVVGCHLTKVAEFYEWKPTKKGEPIAVEVHPPSWLIDAVATHGHYPGVRPVLAVVECPYPRADGSIVTTPGYDPATGTVFRPSMRFEPIPERPTKAHAQTAAKRLLAVVDQFPFVSDADRAVWLAALLTAIARPAIDGPVPGTAVNGNVAGVGKGLMIDTIGIGATGRVVPTSTYPEDKQEAAKVKGAVALAALLIVHFDNLEEGSFYGNSAMDSAITSRVVNERILGSSRYTGELALRTTWFLSGNNVAPGKDAYRRWLPCNLVSDLEHPEEREDIAIPDLHAHVLKHRGDLVRDALTILRAHALDGYPKASKAPLGSFEQWDRIVRGAVFYAYGVDPCQTRRKAADDAPDRLRKLALAEGWRELVEGGDGGEGVTVDDALEVAEKQPLSCPALRSALLQMGKDGKLPSPRSVGNKIGGMKGANVGGFRFEKAGERHRSALWRVVKIATGHPSRSGSGESTSRYESEPSLTRGQKLPMHAPTGRHRDENGSGMGEE